MSSLQFHLDQAFVARQLAETSNARAVAIRNQLVLRLRRLYEADHSEAMSAAYGVDHAVTTALEGLFDNPAPLAPAPDTLLIDQLLLHADPTIFDEQSHPQVAAYRIALLPVAPQQHAPPADHPAPPAPSNIGPPRPASSSSDSSDDEGSSSGDGSGSSDSSESSEEEESDEPAVPPSEHGSPIEQFEDASGAGAA